MHSPIVYSDFKCHREVPVIKLILVVSVFNIIVATQPEVHQGSEIQQVNDVNAGLSVHGAFAHPTGPTESMNTPVLAPGGSKKRYWILTQPSKSPGIYGDGGSYWPSSLAKFWFTNQLGKIIVYPVRFSLEVARRYYLLLYVYSRYDIPYMYIIV